MNVFSNLMFTTLFERKTTAISPLGIRMNDHIFSADITMEDIQPTKSLSVPPWQLVKPIVNMDLTKLPKSSTNSLVFQQHFSKLKTNYTNYVSIYTDGSKDGTSVTSAAIINKHTISCRLPDGMSVFSAEANMLNTVTLQKLLYFLILFSVYYKLLKLSIKKPTYT